MGFQGKLILRAGYLRGSAQPPCGPPWARGNAGGCNTRLRRRSGLRDPGDDVARVIVEDRGQVYPAPADDHEVGEVDLPHLVRPGCPGLKQPFEMSIGYCDSASAIHLRKRSAVELIVLSSVPTAQWRSAMS